MAPVALAAVHDKAGVQLRPTDVLATDLDRDRDVDVAVVGPCRGRRGTCLAGVENERKRLGTVRSVELRGFSLAGASVAPVLTGLVIAGSDTTGPDLAILRSRAGGAYAFAQQFDVPRGVTDVATGDVNGDGRTDIVTGGPGGLGVWLGGPGGSFDDPRFTNTPFAPLAVGVERLDGDAFADIAYVGGGHLAIVELGPGGLFGPPDLEPLRGAAIDLDARRAGPDATPDLIVATTRGLQLFTTAADPAGGVDPAPGTFIAGPRPVGVVLADVTRDNLVDVIALNAGSGNVSTSVASAGGGYRTPIRSLPVGANPVGLDVADFNRDGLPDVVVANAPGGGLGTVTVLQGNGAGAFRTGAAPPPSTGAIPLAFDLTYNHPSPNEGFSWVCVDVTSASGALLNLTMTMPDGRTIGGTLQLKKKATPTARGSFSFKITSFGDYRVRVDARVGGKSASRTKAISVTDAQGSAACGP